MAGVSRTIARKRGKSGGLWEVPYWKARIPKADGSVGLCCFSVTRFGEEGAKALAIEARSRGLNTLRDIAFRENQQPQQVSTADDIALLEASLRAPGERRAQQIAEQDAKRNQNAERAADKLALALIAEEEALDRVAKRSGERYIGRYATPKGTSF